MAILSAEFQSNMTIRTGFIALLVTCLIFGDNSVQLVDGVDFAFAKSHHSDPIYHKTSFIASKRMNFYVNIVQRSDSLSAKYKNILSKDNSFSF